MESDSIVASALRTGASRASRAVARLVVACGFLWAGCGSNIEGKACDSVLDCPSGYACTDGTCRLVDIGDPMDASGGTDAADNIDGPMSMIDAGGLADADDGLEGDAGFGAVGCTLPPLLTPINPVEEFTFPNPFCTGTCGNPGCAPLENDPFPNHYQTVATPTVANLTDDDNSGSVDLDDVPDIVFMAYDGSNYTNRGVIRIMSGRPDANGDPIMHKVIPVQDVNDPCYNPADAALLHDASTSIAIGDLDGDGDLELVSLLSNGPAIAWTPEGCRLWTSTEPAGTNNSNAGAPTIADLDGDGAAEVLIGRVALRGTDGEVVWMGAGDLGRNVFGPQSVAANLDLLGGLEVIAGSTVYGANGSIKCRNTSAGEGLNAIGNFDDDPEAEIVVVGNGEVFLLDTDCSEIWHFDVSTATTTVDNGLGSGTGGACSGSGGGEPTIADFDGDGYPEIAQANSNCYTVINHDGTLLWASRSEDDSSRGTGSSVFDFNGDGTSEVIYNDEHYLRIYNGPDGEVLFSRLNSSRTRHEYPVVADVDNDGNAELVFIENNEVGFACTAGQIGGAGIHILGDDPAVDAWVPTRRIWNQHSYHITNVNEDGTVPVDEPHNWLVPGYNNYRTNLPDTSVLVAPDLVVEILDVNHTVCNAQEAHALIGYQACNRGDVRVGPGVDISVYIDGGLAITAQTTRTLDPGECEALTTDFDVPAPPFTYVLEFSIDDDGTGVGANRECLEDNNTDTRTDVQCEIIG